MEIIKQPRIEFREDVQTLEIGISTPMKGMFQQSDKLWKELSKSLKVMGIREAGPYYLRFRVIDMAGIMGISVGVPVHSKHEGNSRIIPSVLPGGNYACLTFSGHGLPANKLLLDWIKDQNLTMDRWDEPGGDAFACRCETFLTDRRLEPLKKKWVIEVSIKLKDSTGLRNGTRK